MFSRRNCCPKPPSGKKKLIDSLMDEADTYGFDGINLDFESLEGGGRGTLIYSLSGELSRGLQEEGPPVLSVDNYVPAPYNRFYNRREQGNRSRLCNY